ncbi:putative ATPase [Mucilaginibacter sp. UYP25]|uniref:hypothetical protein n=1 Tax=unclassified Mucilaginibacter TaxID=2617802 RepID=UPI0033972AB3
MRSIRMRRIDNYYYQSLKNVEFDLTSTYQETEHFTLTKLFLDNPKAYLRHLMETEE